ncbi:MAG: HNH endonuclease [Gammaproteobacteria bacterium]|nr:HNH endonuclease [Gammaproteobacteria bacterium]
MAQNKNWSFSECYFAVWVFDRLDQDKSLVKQALYNHVADIIRRSPGAVEWKVQNVSFFDPRPVEEKPIAMARRAQADLGKVYEWYWQDKHSARQLYDFFHQEFIFGEQNIFGVPKAILEHGPKFMISKNSIIFEEPQLYVAEGLQSTIRIQARKRSNELIDEGRRYFKEKETNHELRCYACNYTRPESIEKEIVQLHHVRPLAEYDLRGEKINMAEAIQNLTPLCPTCHRIAHTDSPPLRIHDIKSVIRQ